MLSMPTSSISRSTLLQSVFSFPGLSVSVADIVTLDIPRTGRVGGDEDWQATTANRRKVP